MPAKHLIALIVSIIITAASQAQTHPDPPLRIWAAACNQLGIEYHTHNITTLKTDDHFVELAIDGHIAGTNLTGHPDLPTLHRLIALPKGSTPQLTLTNITLDTLTLPPSATIAPVRPASPKDSPLPPRTIDKTTYSLDTFYRQAPTINITPLGTLRDHDIYRLTINPIAYNPTRQQLTLVRTLDATLHTTTSPLAIPLDHWPQRYLIVAQPEMRHSLQPFVQWKQQEGYDIIEIYTTAAQPDSIKNLIRPYFTPASPTQPTPAYILLVGDADQIPPFLGTTHPTGFSSHPTDLPYADYTNDHLPDTYVGRWPVNDTTELLTIIDKTLRYEQALTLDTAALQRILLVAGAENTAPAPTTTNGQIHYLSHEIIAANPTLDTLCYRNPQSALQRPDILQHLTHGIGLLNYTAHCTTAGWTSPNIDFPAIDTLADAPPTIYINNCCLSNQFSGTCFGEQLLRKPDGGAVGTIGATNSTLWNEDYYWAVGPKYPLSATPDFDSLLPGAFDAWIGRLPHLGNATLGEVLVAGNLAVAASGSPYDNFYWEIYCLLGDPSLRPYIGLPQTAALSVPDTIAAGTTSIRVGGTPGAIVSAVQNGQLLGSVKLDDHRSSPLTFSQPVDTLPILFTASGPQLRPVTHTSPVVVMPHRSIALLDPSTTDTTLGLTLANLGNDTLTHLALSLADNPTDNPDQATLADTLLTLDTLLPHSATPLTLTLRQLHWGTHWQASLTATCDNPLQDPATLTLTHYTSDTAPILTLAILNPDSSAVHTLVPHRHIHIVATPTAPYDTLGLTAIALPSLDTHSTTSPHLDLDLPDSLTHLMLTTHIGRGNYRRTQTHYLTAGHRTDNFEHGANAYPWGTSSLHPWQLDTTQSHSGRYSLRSAPIDYRQTSDLTLQLTLTSADTISFWVKTSTEERYDKLIFSVDGTRRQEFWGESAWQHSIHRLSAGQHLLRWRYVKDESGNGGSDCVWLDDIRLPFALWDAPYGTFDTEPTVGISPTPSVSNPLSLQPNPANNSLTLATPQAADIVVMNSLGQPIAHLTLAPNTPHHLDTRTLPAGIYLVICRTATTTTHTKLIVTH